MSRGVGFFHLGQKCEKLRQKLRLRHEPRDTATQRAAIGLRSEAAEMALPLDTPPQVRNDAKKTPTMAATMVAPASNSGAAMTVAIQGRKRYQTNESGERWRLRITPAAVVARPVFL